MDWNKIEKEFKAKFGFKPNGHAEEVLSDIFTCLEVMQWFKQQVEKKKKNRYWKNTSKKKE